MIDDDIAQGFAKLEQVVVDKPVLAPAPPTSARQPSSAFEFRGGPRYTPILLAVVLPFAWLAVMYFALANLLSESALDSRGSEDSEARIEQLERELKALRSEVAGAPRTPKSKPTRPKDAKKSGKPSKAEPEPAAPEPAPPTPEPAALRSPTASAGPS